MIRYCNKTRIHDKNLVKAYQTLIIKANKSTHEISFDFCLVIELVF